MVLKTAIQVCPGGLAPVTCGNSLRIGAFPDTSKGSGPGRALTQRKTALMVIAQKLSSKAGRDSVPLAISSLTNLY
jgi:hypothetical protein